MTRVLVVNPLGCDLYDQLTLEVVGPAVAPDTKVVVRSLGDGVPPTPFLPAASRFYNQLLAAVERAERDGFDAVAIACCSDPGLPEAKELVRIPVTAPMEAAVHTAAPLGRLGVIAPRIPSGDGENLPTDANWVRNLVQRYGMAHAFAGVRSAPAGHPSAEVTTRLLDQDPDGLRRLVRDEMAASIAGPAMEQARRSYVDDEATVLFFACTIWGGLLDPIRQAVPIPVLDPLVNTVQFAELLARAGAKR